MQDMATVWERIDREVAATPMPREYADLYRNIFCRDCNKSSVSLFHIVGMKCGECESYNTSLDGGPLLRKTNQEGAVTFTPLTDQEVAGLTRRMTLMMAGRQLRRRMINLLAKLTRWLRKIWTD